MIKMIKTICWGMFAVVAAAVLYTIIKLCVMLRTARQEHPGGSVAIDFVSFARNYLFTTTALTIGVLIFAGTFLIVSLVQKKQFP